MTLDIKPTEKTAENFLEKIIQNFKGKFVPPNFANMTVNDKIRAIEGSMSQIVFNQGIIILAMVIIIFLNYI